MTRLHQLILVLLVAAAPLRAAEPAGPIAFAARMSADDESTAVDSPGLGKAEFSLDRDSLRLSWTVTFSGLTSPVTAVQIHGPQRIGANAGVQVDMGRSGLKPPLHGSEILNDAQVQYLIAGWMYVNVHTAKYPAGEIRGKIQRVDPDAN
jgi:hypothetical protein